MKKQERKVDNDVGKQKDEVTKDGKKRNRSMVNSEEEIEVSYK